MIVLKSYDLRKRTHTRSYLLTVNQFTNVILLDVITAVPKFAAERSHPVTDAPTFQHAAPDHAENAH